LNITSNSVRNCWLTYSKLVKIMYECNARKSAHPRPSAFRARGSLSMVASEFPPQHWYQSRALQHGFFFEIYFLMILCMYIKSTQYIHSPDQQGANQIHLIGKFENIFFCFLCRTLPDSGTSSAPATAGLKQLVLRRGARRHDF